MIYITGDTHSDFSRFEIDEFPIQVEMTKDGVRIDIWTHFMRGCIIDYVH